MLKHLSLFAIILFITNQATAQNVCTPEFLWSLGRVSAHHYDAAEKNLYYTITHKDVKAGTSSTEKYRVNIENGHNVKVSDFDNEENSITDGYNGAKISSNGNYMMYSKEVEVEKIAGKDIYPEYSNSEIYVYNDLNERHWDTWEDGKYSHLFLAKISNDQVYNAIDLLAGQKYDCPTMPFGGSEDYIFTPDNRGVIYVCKKKYGKEYAVSTNTDLYYYDIALGTTSNITNNNPGYDLNPCFSADGRYLAWTQMKRDGYESDKNDIVVMNWKDRSTVNLTAHWDGTVGSFFWSPDNEMIYFIAAVRGTEQIFADRKSVV